MTKGRKNKIIEAICKGKHLFIRNTGTEIAVDYIGTDMDDYKTRTDKKQYANIEFVGIPSSSTLKLLNKYHIKKNSHTGKMDLSGVINFELISLVPYESKAGKLLYGKKGK